ncbi:hypothetical protein CI109_101849 [Kwoniella shandongensis]|uniref:Uncharacterized protein n=1 Tax=Kwoniella shandongensis TaxID=1734106 RepID=A0A5M6BPG5_9TREE|nr:uncharacterized protein CI109_007029 [Kwoniella shandongensis]KAA5524643.1 hypothetical protein CI109_007029 [Kwoniella shandongensis]
MSDKGKGKEVSPSNNDGPIELSDTDSDTDFFVSKRKPVIRAATPPRSPSPVVRSHSESEDSDDPSQKKKKKTRRSQPKPTLPEWTRHTSHESKARVRKGSSVMRGSTEETRDRTNTIVIDGSDDEVVEASTSRPGRRRVELTPPPELSEKKKQELRKLVESHYGAKDTVPDNPLVDVDLYPSTQTSPDKPRTDEEKCYITVYMEADPERRANAAPAALKEFQKARTLQVYRNESLRGPIESLAERIGKRAEDIVLTYEGNRVYSRMTPRELGIGHRADMTGYEKPYFERKEKERRAKIEALVESDDDDDPKPISDPSASPTTDTNFNGNSTLPATASEVLDNPIRFVIKDAKGGEVKLKVATNITANTVLRYYCQKVERPKTDANQMKLVLDGDVVEPDTPMGELDLSDGDMIEVRED